MCLFSTPPSLGYAVQPVASRGRQGYVVGAPRYQHVGKVVLFYWDPKESAWKAEGEAEGDQVGGNWLWGCVCKHVGAPCVCVCQGMWRCVPERVSGHACSSWFVGAYTVRVDMCMGVRVCACLGAFVCVCVSVCMCMHFGVHMCVYMCVCLLVCI